MALDLGGSGRSAFTGGLAFLLLTSVAPGALAQIVTDGSVGPATTLTPTGGRTEIGQGLGTRAGGNLFHSFTEFGVRAGEQAAFTGDGGVRNVVARVTGGQESGIDGQISVEAGGAAGANLFFVNPAGIRFGEGASINVPNGRAHFAAADGIVHADGQIYSATSPDGGSLSVAEPAAFGFLEQTVGRLTVSGADLSQQNATGVMLAGRDVEIDAGALIGTDDTGGETVIAAGGPDALLPISTAALRAPSDRLEGTVSIGGQSAVFSDSVNSGARAGSVIVSAERVEIDGGATVSATNFGDGPAGDIAIFGNSVAIRDLAYVGADTINGKDPQNFGQISVISGGFLLDGNSIISASAADFGATNPLDVPGDAGSIILSANRAEILNGSQIVAAAHGADSFGGGIQITAGELLVSGTGGVDLPTTPGTRSGLYAYGDTAPRQIILDQQGNEFENFLAVNIEAGDLVLQDQATITITSPGTSLAGNVLINQGRPFETAGNVVLSTGAQIDGRTATGSEASFVFVDANNFQMTDAEVLIGSGVVGDGPSDFTAGIFQVEANNIFIAGASLVDVSTTSTAPSNADRDAISLDAPLVTVAGQAVLDAGGFGQATGRGIFLTGNDILVTEEAQIVSDARGQAVGGTIGFLVDRTDPEGIVQITGDSEVNASGFDNAVGGNILVNAPNVVIDGLAQVTADAAGFSEAGDITVLADAISLGGRARISSTGSGDAFGGRIRLDGLSSIRVGGFGEFVEVEGSDTPVFVPGAQIVASGENANAGLIEIAAPDILITEDAAIASVTVGTGTGGGVRIGELLLDDGTFLTLAERVTISGQPEIRSGTLSLGNSGFVEVSARESILLTDNASIRAGAPNIDEEPTEGLPFGNAGFISLSAPLLEVSGNVVIETLGRGGGAGGTIQLFGESERNGPLDFLGNGARNFLLDGTVLISGNAFISNSAQEGGPAGEIEVGGEVVEFSELAFIQSTGTDTSEGGLVNVFGRTSLLVTDETFIIADVEDGVPFGVQMISPEVVIDGNSLIASGTFGSSNGGAVIIDAVRFELSGNAAIQTETSGAGNSGFIDVDGLESVQILENARLFAGPEQIFDDVDPPLEVGGGGDILVNAPVINILGPNPIAIKDAVDDTDNPSFSNINVESRPLVEGGTSGDAGRIELIADTIRLEDTSINAQSATSGGGKIDLVAGDFIIVSNSAIVSRVAEGAGGAGEIFLGGFVDDDVIILADAESAFVADAADGVGGDIRLGFDGDIAFIDAEALVDATSDTNTAGTVEVAGAEENVVQIESVNPGFFDPRQLIADPCAAGTAQRSSLVVVGAGGARVESEGTAGFFLDAVPYPDAPEAGLGEAPPDPLGPSIALSRGCGPDVVLQDLTKKGS